VGTVDPHLVVAATFADSWSAELAAGYLRQSGIPAWVQAGGLDDPFKSAGSGATVRLLVPIDRLESARALLAETMPEADGGPLEPPAHGHPVWVYPVALVLLLGIAIAAIPGSLRVPSLAVALAGYFVWRKIRSG